MSGYGKTPARFLITTACQGSWNLDEPVLFLGDWCKLLSERDIWAGMDEVTVPYHWDDRLQLYEDYRKLKASYERMLEFCVIALNEFHGVNHSAMYWRILIGPWLLSFMLIALDRWKMIDAAIKSFRVGSTVVLNIDEEAVVPQHFDDFVRLFTDDKWNHWIYSRIIEYLGFEPIIRRDDDETGNSRPSGNKRDLKTAIKRIVAIPLARIWKVKRRNKFFLFSSGLGFWNQAKLELALGQLPSHIIADNLLEHIGLNKELRNRLEINAGSNDPFESFLSSIIPSQIPRYYLEGYRQLRMQACAHHWPANPAVIFTSNGTITHDLFKCWTAEKKESGSRLILGQHGGQYGVARWMPLEEHETKIADGYFTWGWQGRNATSLPAAKLVDVTKRIKSGSKSGILLVQTCAPRYSYWIYSMPIGPQWARYFDDQIRFAESLPEGLREQLIVRTYPKDYGWSQKQRWLERLPATRFDAGGRSLECSISEHRLFVGTYNATTFLETLAANVPTLLFWNPERWELRDSAREDYEMLRAVGILYDTPEEAAKQVCLVWDELEAWWQGPTIQKTRRRFVNHYARTSDEWKGKWIDAFRQQYAV